MDKAQEKIGDDIYKALTEIQKEEGVRLSDKAFIADCLSERLYKDGYRKPPEGQPPVEFTSRTDAEEDDDRRDDLDA